jgi:hypothetical protein
MIKYKSSGRLGDFFCQLSVINEKFIATGNKGILYISQDDEIFAHGLQRAYNDTKDFILGLPYISEYKIYNGEPYDINLSSWRFSPFLYKTSFYEIFNKTYNVSWAKNQWLFSGKNTKFDGKILISCNNTFRFPSLSILKKVFETYTTDNMIFISQSYGDYENFNKKTGIKLENYIAKDIVDFINAINSCSLFISSLSSPLCFAYGLKKKNISLLSGFSDDLHVVGLDKKITEIFS